MNRKRQRGHATAAVTLAVVLAFLVGCDDDTIAPPRVNKVKVTVTVKEVYVIAECEGTTGTNPGDFTFELLFYTEDKTIAVQQYTGTFSGLNGQTVNIPDIVVEMARVPKAGQWFYMEFGATEWDNGVPDSGMNNSRGLGEYGWPADKTAEEIYVQTVSGSGRCSVMFVYTISAIQI